MRNFSYEILVDHGETTNKCTILPLAYRPDFKISRYKGPGVHSLAAPILLHPDGVLLNEVGSDVLRDASGIAAVDCIWRRLQPIVNGMVEISPLLVRIPSGFETAYPRKSKISGDPDGGLATIEALFIAAAFCGVWDESLLCEYWFGRSFLELNHRIFKGYEVASCPDNIGGYYAPTRAADSRSRRLARGKPANPAILADVF